MKKALKIILATLAVALMLTSAIAVRAKPTTYEGTMTLHGSGTIWIASFSVSSEECVITLKVPQALFELIPERFEGETPFDLAIGEYYTLRVESSPSALVEFECVKPGDANCDDEVDYADLEAVEKAFGTDIRWPHGTDLSQYNPYADFNIDSKVDAEDLWIVASNYKPE